MVNTNNWQSPRLPSQTEIALSYPQTHTGSTFDQPHLDGSGVYRRNCGRMKRRNTTPKTSHESGPLWGQTHIGLSYELTTPNRHSCRNTTTSPEKARRRTVRPSRKSWAQPSCCVNPKRCGQTARHARTKAPRLQQGIYP